MYIYIPQILVIKKFSKIWFLQDILNSAILTQQPDILNLQRIFFPRISLELTELAKFATAF